LAMVEREAHVVWQGNLTEGSGNLSEGSGVLNEAPVTFASRVERPDGKTSPEELIAAAHATCYAMALSNVLTEEHDAQPERLEVDAVCTMDDQQLKITNVNLDVRGTVPGIGEDEFENAAREAEQLCPVSNALRGNVAIQLQTRLES
jgi:lipoyl-dependent peroxiredoxin